MAKNQGQSISLNDIDLYYEVRGDGPPLVLLHGFTGAGGDWVHALDLDALAERYRLILPDLRGHGRSTNPSRKFTHRQAALDIHELLNQLKIDRFQAIGLSGGGNTLLHMATQEPARVESMVVVSSPSHFPAEARAIMSAWNVDTLSDDEWRTLRARHHHGDDQIRALYACINAFAASYDDMNFTPPYLSTITARTLIVTGDRDPLYPVEIFAGMYRAIPKSHLWVVPGGGHVPIFGAWQPEFARVATAFLDGDLK